MLVNPYITSKETQTIIALWSCGLYTWTNCYRNRGGGSGEEAVDAVMQAIREGAGGHRWACRLLDNRWATGATSTPLPPPPNPVSDSNILKQRSLQLRVTHTRNVVLRR